MPIEVKGTLFEIAALKGPGLTELVSHTHASVVPRRIEYDNLVTIDELIHSMARMINTSMYYIFFYFIYNIVYFINKFIKYKLNLKRHY